MSLEIERPLLPFAIYEGKEWIRRSDFDAWYDKLLRGGVEVFSDYKLVPTLWDSMPEAGVIRYTHKALLINITPINQVTQESREETIIKNLIRHIEGQDLHGSERACTMAAKQWLSDSSRK